MKKRNFLSISLAATLLLTTPTLVQANEDSSDELSFSETVRDLNSQIKAKTPLSLGGSSLVNSTIHAGFGLTNSVNSVRFNGKDRTRFDDGLQLSVGADLINKNWMGEAVLRNFGKSRVANEEMSLREFDIRLHYIEKVNTHFGYRIINGLGARYMRWSDRTTNFSQNTSTPHYNLGFAFDVYATKNLSLGVEFSGRTTLIGQTMDQNALDFTIKMDTYL